MSIPTVSWLEEHSKVTTILCLKTFLQTEQKEETYSVKVHDILLRACITMPR